jgi:hypothetical protein
MDESVDVWNMNCRSNQNARSKHDRSASRSKGIQLYFEQIQRHLDSDRRRRRDVAHTLARRSANAHDRAGRDRESERRRRVQCELSDEDSRHFASSRDFCLACAKDLRQVRIGRLKIEWEPKFGRIRLDLPCPACGNRGCELMFDPEKKVVKRACKTCACVITQPPVLSSLFESKK